MTAAGIQGLHVALNGQPVLCGINAQLRGGEVVGLIGPNGAGKTTLLRAVAALVPAQAGSVTVNKRPLVAWDRRQLARVLAYLPQGAPCSWPLDAWRLVALGRLPHQPPWRSISAADRHAIDNALNLADVAGLAGRSVLTLSGGERARVMLARALAVEPEILLADEPVAGLDPEHQLRVMGTLRDLAASGVAVVVTLHDLSLASRFCDRLILLNNGIVAVEGSPPTVLAPSILATVFGIEAEQGHRDNQTYIVPWTVVDDRLHAREGRTPCP